jgi:ADP-ribosyl-[dinitrogen reductase] hydrolase
VMETISATDDLRSSFEGCLLGGAVGDALGLPWEGLSKRLIARRLGDGPLRYRFLYGRGMVSDDTEHAILVAQALLRSGNDSGNFQRSLAMGLRAWLIGLPAGIGLATLKACLRLSIGVPPHRSGVSSAGNGPAMRAPLLGVYFADRPDLLLDYCDRSSVLTHTDERAVLGARVVAVAARCACFGTASEAFFADALDACDSGSKENPWPEMLRTMQAAHESGQSLEEFASSIGIKDRVSGYVMHSVPVAVYAWLANRLDLRASLEAAIRLGGDTDTVAAIAGGIGGAELGTNGVPRDLVEGLWEWPRTAAWMEALADRLAEKGDPLPVAWPLIWPRNATFTAVVLYHGFRRLI